MIVIDASVAAKWLLREKDSEYALAYLDSPLTLIAPEQIRIEVLSAITRRFRQDMLTEKEAHDQCNLWLEWLEDDIVDVLPNKDCATAAVKLSLALRHPLADCLYLAAARLQKAPLVTADKLLYERAADADIECRLLNDTH